MSRDPDLLLGLARRQGRQAALAAAAVALVLVGVAWGPLPAVLPDYADAALPAT